MCTQNVYTDANLFISTVLQTINDFARELVDLRAFLDVPNEADLVLEYSNKSPKCKYYLVDHDQLLIFWLHDCDLTEHIRLGGAQNDAHISELLATLFGRPIGLTPPFSRAHT